MYGDARPEEPGVEVPSKADRSRREDWERVNLELVDCS